MEPLTDPLLEMVARTAQGLSPELGAVFALNCLGLLRDVLAVHRSLAPVLCSTLDERIASASSLVSDSEVRGLLTRAQLWSSMQALRQDDKEEDKSNLAALAGLDAKSLADNVRALETSVLGAGDLMQSLGACGKIQDEPVRLLVKAQVVGQLVEAYGRIHTIVHDPDSNYPDAGQIVRYTPEQFQSLMENS